MSSSRRRLALAESLGALALILLYIWWLRSRLPAAWMGILGALVISHALRRETPGKLGFRTAGFRAALSEWSPALALLAMTLFALGTILRTVRSVSFETAFGGLVYYCFWGLFQQYVLNGYFVNRFREFAGSCAPHRVAAMSAAAFSLAHTPNWFLMAVTLAGGYVCALSYQKHRNLFFLGLAHGIVGFLLYLVVPDSVSRHLYVGPRWFSAGRF